MNDFIGLVLTNIFVAHVIKREQTKLKQSYKITSLTVRLFHIISVKQINFACMCRYCHYACVALHIVHKIMIQLLNYKFSIN